MNYGNFAAHETKLQQGAIQLKCEYIKDRQMKIKHTYNHNNFVILLEQKQEGRLQFYTSCYQVTH